MAYALKSAEAAAPLPKTSTPPLASDLLQEASGEGVPRYEGRPRGSSLGPRSYPDEKRVSPSQQTVAAGEQESVEVLREARVDDGRANVERWRAGNVASSNASSSGRSRRGSDAQSLASYGGGSLIGFGGMADAGALEGMTDAEIAQHHFRLAQQHLEAAQRLAMAAAAQPARPSPIAPSPLSSCGSPAQPPHRQFDLMSSFGDEESVIDPSEPAHSPTSPDTSLYDDATSEFGRLSIRDAVDASYDWRLSRSLSSLHPSSWSESAPSPGVLSTSAASTRSAPTRSSSITKESLAATRVQEAPVHPVLPARRPQPAPHRRATAGAAMAMTPMQSGSMQSASTLAPSLYGGGLPPGLPDRIGAVGGAALIPTSQSPAGATEPSVMDEDDSLVGSGDEVGPLRDFDDAASDFHDAQSSFSHVTYATLPPYELSSPSPPPPVPALPPQFAAAAAIAHPYAATPTAPPVPDAPLEREASDTASAGSSASTARPSLPQPSSQDDFHGFRPRVAPGPPAAAPRTIVNAPSPYAISQPAYPAYGLPSSQPAAPAYRAVQPQPQAYVAPAGATAHLQPHSYILGPNGQPIPVYAAPSSFPVGGPPPPAASAPISRAPLPIHSQPLQFNHTFPYLHNAARQAGSAAHPSGIHHHSPSSSNLLSSASTAQPYPSAPATVSHHHPGASSSSLTPSNSSGAPTVSFASAAPRRPSSAGSNGSNNSAQTTFSTATHSTALKNRMASLRAKVRSPHVRFQSPDPTEAKARAMSSVFEDDDEGGIESMSIEQRMAKQRSALAASMAMLT
ncbi:hypothetical protein JCM10213_000599 [Rhodosporidiobolus nylandii]